MSREGSDREEFGTTRLCPGCEAGLPDQTERITMSADSGNCGRYSARRSRLLHR